MSDRKCSKCGENFVRGVRQRWCKACHAKAQKKWRKAHFTVPRVLHGTLTVRTALSLLKEEDAKRAKKRRVHA